MRDVSPRAAIAVLGLPRIHRRRSTLARGNANAHQEAVDSHAITGLDIRVSGRDRGGIKDYIAETFHEILGSEPEDPG